MKKMLSIAASLLIAAVAQAQLLGVKIVPTLEKGMKATYETKSSQNLGPQMAPINTTTTTAYEVKEAAADGYVIEETVTAFTTDADKSDPNAMLLSVSNEMLLNLPILLKTDKDGKVVDVLNLDEVRTRAEAQVSKAVDAVYEATPELAQMMPKDNLKQTMLAGINKENVIIGYEQSHQVTALNGKTVVTGAQETYYNEKQNKMKRLYLLNAKDGSSITVTATLDMSKEEMKALIFAQLAESMPEQAEAMREQIGQMIDSGALSIDMTEKTNYSLAPNKWVEKIDYTSTTHTMGQELGSTITVTLTSHSW